MNQEPGDSADTIARDATYYRAPAHLKKRVQASLARDSREARAPFLWRAFGVALACAAVAVVTWNLAAAMLAPGGDERVAQEIVTAHVRSLMAPNHLADVVSTDQHTVKPWFTGKVDFAPPVGDYAASGFSLTGGRLDYVDGHPAAAITYRHRLHVVNLFVWPATGETDRDPHRHLRQGYSLVGWTRGGLRYCVVGDIATADLEVLAGLVRAST
jgi:anti-sigma factor RsiW